MSEPEVLHELTNEGILIVTLNRPEHMNAINAGIMEGIQSALKDVKENNDIRVLVLTGNGRGFCAGADVSTGGPVRSADAVKSRADVMDNQGPGNFIEALSESYVPIIGAINGATAGAGFGLSLCCDVRIASDQARMGSIFIKRGVGPDYATSYWLPRIVGLSKAYELMYSGDLLDAHAALEIGLVNRVVPHDSLMEETLAYARVIAKGPPLANALTRRTLVQSLDNSLHQHLILEWVQQKELLASKDAREGFTAFLEKREPKFKGS